MNFEDTVLARRMVRNFTEEPVEADVVHRLIRLALRAPSAGNTSASEFLVLHGEAQTESFWQTTMNDSRRATFAWPGLFNAPVIILPCCNSSKYVQRYSEADKAHTNLGKSTEDWGVPYWHIDTAMAAMTILLGATDAGLGALFFGLFDNETKLKERFSIPDEYQPIGAIAIGHAASEQRLSSSAGRSSNSVEEVSHFGCWKN